MLVEIVVLVVFLYPTVLGQSVEFEQECHVLKTLETLMTRLQEQDTRLTEQDTLLEQEKARSEKQKALLEHQSATLEKQQARINVLEVRLNASKQSTDGVYLRLMVVGFSAGRNTFLRYCLLPLTLKGKYPHIIVSSPGHLSTSLVKDEASSSTKQQWACL